MPITLIFLLLIVLLNGVFLLRLLQDLVKNWQDVKLIVAAISLMMFGAFNSLGIGSYTPTMVTLYALGLNPLAAFPIIMGASAFSVPLSSIQFIKYGLYSRKITLIAGLFGVIGALLCVHLVNALDISMLQWLIAAILLYSGSSMLINELNYKGSTVIPVVIN